MKTQMKLIIPLLDDSLTKEDFSPETGFIDAFSTDINRPYINDCIFLMYNAELTTNKAIDCMHKLRELRTLYKSYYIHINGVLYDIYAVKIINPEVRRLLKGLRNSKYESDLKAAKFWNFEEGDVNHFMCNPSSTFNYECTSVPEEDYIPPLSEIRRTKKAGVPVIRNLSLCLFY